MAEIWEQQEGETDTAFAAFVVYRQRRPPRSVLASYRDWKKDTTIKRATGRWQQWARDHAWAVRATAFDKHLDSVRTSVEERVVAEITEQRVREIEISALNTLKETAALAHSRITDVMSWDEFGKITLKPSKDIPDHAIGAISEVKQTYDKMGRPQLDVKMHGKNTPVDLLGKHYQLWQDAKDQAQKAQTNAFLEFLNFIKSGALDNLPPGDWPEPSLKNPPPWITVEIPGVTK